MATISSSSVFPVFLEKKMVSLELEFPLNRESLIIGNL
jgi:hypothetical protein